MIIQTQGGAVHLATDCTQSMQNTLDSVNKSNFLKHFCYFI